ncbi:MAG: bifunctional 2-polyprenyl-6-hydroxyphenol methylase/3-demethylubiquinol 3-O-methyltransferase UbiG [Candidatus Caenarcaniphilales bacterium]|nr:bifunctional 2-polyprenyl-6-hydroxyphenol methylase/3-demethylubiquinol 3-O-methyltransferase UbiG [Candidatus Caenarcaniphilales bacterium]
MEKIETINNKFYDSLADQWWEANDHMIYFLRAESKIKLEYLINNFDNIANLEILDIGAGGGFISIPLAKLGAKVTALDNSLESLKVLEAKAKMENIENNISIFQADATKPYTLNKQFDLVLAFDVLEHVINPKELIEHSLTHMKTDGYFAYHTLNQSFLCWLIYLQIVPRLISKDPGNVHRHEFNIKPKKMLEWLKDLNLQTKAQIGIRAPFFQAATWDLLTKRQINTEMNFEFTKDLSLGYLGLAHLQDK